MGGGASGSRPLAEYTPCATIASILRLKKSAQAHSMNRPPHPSWGLKAGAPRDRRTRQPLDAPSGLGGRVSQHSSLDGADSLTSCCCHGRVICTVLAPFVANVPTETESTPRGFEPLRAEPNGFRVHHLSHPVTVSDEISASLPKSNLIFRHIARRKFGWPTSCDCAAGC